MVQKRAVKEAAFSTFAANVPYAFHYWTPETPNSLMIMDPHNYEVRSFVFGNYMRNEPEVWPVLKEFYVYALQNAWQVFLPSPYMYVPYHPWLKGYSGESSTGYGDWVEYPKYIWIDQDLKKEMGY